MQLPDPRSSPPSLAANASAVEHKRHPPPQYAGGKGELHHQEQTDQRPLIQEPLSKLSASLGDASRFSSSVSTGLAPVERRLAGSPQADSS
jgi:hypothetical protein